MRYLRSDNPAWRRGAFCGVLLGGCWVVYDLINNLTNPNARTNSLLNNGISAAVAVLSMLAGFIGARPQRRVRDGLFAGLTAAVVSAAIGLGTLWFVTLAFMETIRHNTFMIEDFRRSGMTDMDAFIIEDALGATFFGGLLLLAAGVTLGALGGLAGKATARRRQA